MGPAIEEATVIALQQHLCSQRNGSDHMVVTPRVALVDMPNEEPVQWLCDFTNEARRKWHQEKMRVSVIGIIYHDILIMLTSCVLDQEYPLPAAADRTESVAGQRWQ